MQDRGSGPSGAAHASHLADGRAAVGRSCWHGICSPGKHRLCLYGIAAQPWYCRRLDCSDGHPRPVRTIWPRGLDWHSWRCVVPRECTKSLSHYPSCDPDLPLRLSLAWSLGWAAIHRVHCCPTRHSYLGNIAATGHNRHCHTLCLVPARDDPANAAANIGASISAADNEVLPVWLLHLSVML